MPTRVWAALAFDNPRNSWQRTAVGLVFEDNFFRDDSDTVGNGWFENEAAAADISIASNDLVFGDQATVRTLHRTSPTQPLDFIIHAVGRNGSSGSEAFHVIARSDQGAAGFGAVTGYRATWDQTAGNLTVEEYNAGVPTQVINGTDAADDNIRGLRLVVRDGGTVNVDAYITNILGSLEDLTFSVDDSVTLADASPITNTEYGISAFRDANIGRVYACGRNVIVNGLPTGWKAGLEGDASTVEVGGTATIDVDQRTLPAVSLVIKDGSDNVIQEVKPSNGIYGGAIFDNVIDPTFPDDGIRELDSRSVSRDGADELLAGGADYAARVITATFQLQDTVGGEGVLGEVAQNVEQKQGCDIEITPIIDMKSQETNAIIRTKVPGDGLKTNFGFHSNGNQAQLEIEVRNFSQEASFAEAELGRSEWWIIPRRRHR